jgi:small multidrug resistance family-3 protein
MRSSFLFITAGLFEIGGGYLVWLWLREKWALGYGILGFVLLAAYGVIPILQPPEHPFGRIYAAYGGVFILLSLAWGWGIDGHRPDLRDYIGAAICLGGILILMSPRHS